MGGSGDNPGSVLQGRSLVLQLQSLEGPAVRCKAQPETAQLERTMQPATRPKLRPPNLGNPISQLAHSPSNTDQATLCCQLDLQS